MREESRNSSPIKREAKKVWTSNLRLGSSSNS
jgi:hypothetical protein